MELKRLGVYRKEYRESWFATIEKADRTQKEMRSAGYVRHRTLKPVPGMRRMITPSAVRTAT
jgi:hypothetical protein